MNKVALVIPYFGKWPEWINLYLYSCSRQKNIDFLFYTDCEIPEKTYPNTIFRRISFADYCSLASKRLNIDFHPTCGYKLCDLRPFYGMVHEEDLRDYEWWGFGDIDLVYGDLSLLLSERNMKKYDLLTTHFDHIAGHFTVIRKASRYTRICMKIPDWEGKLCDEQHYSMDEYYFLRAVKPIFCKHVMKVYNMMLHRFSSPNKFFYWYDVLSRCISWIKSPVYLKEFFTSFAPAPGSVCTYNLQTGDIYCPTRQTTKIRNGGGKLYLHFLYFKKPTNLQSEIYWHSGFYKIPQDYDFEKGGIVEISTEGIKLQAP